MLWAWVQTPARAAGFPLLYPQFVTPTPSAPLFSSASLAFEAELGSPAGLGAPTSKGLATGISRSAMPRGRDVLGKLPPTAETSAPEQVSQGAQLPPPAQGPSL